MSDKLEADARIVKTVRSLQKTQPKDKNRESTADISDEKSDKPHSGIIKSQTPVKNSADSMKIKSPMTSSISIDGAKTKKPDDEERNKIFSVNNKKSNTLTNSNLHQINIAKKNSFISSSTNFNKTVSDKNRKLVDSYMIKYKGFCIGFVKENEELKKLSDLCRINNIENFLEEYLFNNAIFQYKCEQMFLNNDANKNKKEKLIKDECKKLLENILLDLQVESQIKKLTERIDNHYENIKNINFVKNI